MIRDVGLLDLENVVAGEDHVLHRLIHRRWLSLVETARGEFHARAEIARDVGGSREYVTVLREVLEVHPERADKGNLGIGKALPGLRSLHVIGQPG
jgi:hypothetical protein